MYGRLKVYRGSNKELKINQISAKKYVLDVCKWMARNYKKHTIVYYLDGSISFFCKGGFLQMDIAGTFEPVVLTPEEVWLLEREKYKKAASQLYKKNRAD